MKHVDPWIAAYLAGELDAATRADFDRHVDGCATCRDKVAGAGKLWEGLAAASVETQRTASLWPAVRARTLGSGRNGQAWFFGGAPWARATLGAAAVAAGLALGVWWPAATDLTSAADEPWSEVTWLTESSWLSDTSWLNDTASLGLDERLLGLEAGSEGDGS